MGSEVTLWGEGPNASRLPIDEVAHAAGTIGYELMCALARRVAEALRLPVDPRSWSDDDTLVFLQAEGDDLPGDLVIGDGPLRRAQSRLLVPPPPLPEAERAARYPMLAAATATRSSAPL